jgi:hypothetical protein
MLILPIPENMNRGKSQTFMEWASENARVPDCQYLPNSAGEYVAKCSGQRRPDFVMKADDDAFINLAELEKRLRIIPKSKAYWGCKSNPSSFGCACMRQLMHRAHVQWRCGAALGCIRLQYRPGLCHVDGLGGLYRYPGVYAVVQVGRRGSNVWQCAAVSSKDGRDCMGAGLMLDI